MKITAAPAIGLLLATMFLVGSAHTEGAADFYRGKTVTLVVGDDPSGQYMVNGRLLAAYIAKYIPGQPTVITQAMPGASSVTATNYMYSVAHRDGTVFALPNKSVAMFEATHLPGVQYRAAEFNWMGSMTASNNVVVVLASTGVRTLEDAKHKEVIMGAQGVSGTLATYPLVLNRVAGTRFKLVLGYAGANIINLAMDRGEVEGRGSYTWTDLKHSRPEWLAERKVNVLVQIGVRREPDLPDVPILPELARDETEREILTFICSDTLLGRPFFLPPKVPTERVEAMRAAFDRTMRDSEFLGEAERLGINIAPVGGVELQRKITETVTTRSEIVSIAEKWMSQ